MNAEDKNNEEERNKGFNTADIPSHEHIEELIEDIKTFEKKYPLYDVKQPEKVKSEEFELEIEKTVDSDVDLLSKTEVTGKIKKFFKTKKRNISEKKTGDLHNKSLFPKISIKRKKETTQTEKTEKKGKVVKPNVFRIGYNDSGELVNLDLKKKEFTEKSKGKKNFFKKLFKFKKGEEQKSEEAEDEKTSKIKNVLGKIGKLKNAIPFKRNK